MSTSDDDPRKRAETAHETHEVHVAQVYATMAVADALARIADVMGLIVDRAGHGGETGGC